MWSTQVGEFRDRKGFTFTFLNIICPGLVENGANGGVFAVKPVDCLVLGTFATSYFVKEAKAVLQNQAYFKKVKKLKPNISFQNEPGLR